MSKSPAKEMFSCDLNCSEKRATLKDVVMEHFCCILFEFFGPLKKWQRCLLNALENGSSLWLRFHPKLVKSATSIVCI